MPDDKPTTDLATREQSKTPVAFAVAPATLDEAWRWAQAAAQSVLVPKAFQGKPADVLTAVQMGVELGLPPMTALQSIAVVNGRPGLFGDGLLGLVMASRLYAGHDEYFEVATVAPGATPVEPGPYQRVATLTADDLKRDTTRAVVTFERFMRDGRRVPFTRMFSVGDAKRAGLLSKQGPWQEYPGRMLAWRALGFAARAAFPDVLKGLRTVDELADLPPDADPPAPPVAPVVRRKSQVDDAPAVVDVTP